MPDDFIQPDAPEDPQNSPRDGRRRPRGSKGNIKAQSWRYRQRNRSRLNSYMARYMANRRSKGKENPDE